MKIPLFFRSPRGCVFALAALACLAASPAARAADSVVVFNEINYHPRDAESGTEWIELHNLMGVDVDMSGWRLSSGVDFVFPAGTVISGHGFLLVAAEPQHPSIAGRNALGPFSGSLNNAGETLRLRNNSDRIMDEVTYDDDGEWPSGADGSGSTLAKRNQGSADARAANWVASPEPGGTPGAPNFPLAGAPPTVTSLVALDAVWKYRDNAAAPPAEWKNVGFDDTAWSAGPAAMYAGDANISGAGDGLLAWWPLDETGGNIVSNAVPGGPVGDRIGGSWINDPVRGRVLSFNGASDYVHAGDATIPVMEVATDFTWAFWAYSTVTGDNSVVVGNRFAPFGGDWNPREFIKFTPSAFEFHRNGSGENIDYPNFPTNVWIHHAVVKSGPTLTYYRDGAAAGSAIVSQPLLYPQPLYFGGDQSQENWRGRLDDVALWTKALPAASVAGMADGTYTPLTAPTDGTGGGSLKTEIAAATTHYFRCVFSFTDNPSMVALTLRHLVDDGAVFYLNGAEILRVNLPDGAIDHATAAGEAVDAASLSPVLAVPADALRHGDNVLAVEVHQAVAGPDDMVFAASLTATALPASAASASALVINEISPWHEAPFLIELANLSSSPLPLAGYSLVASNGGSHALPATEELAAGGFLVLDAAALGFEPRFEDRIFLYGPGALLADARIVTDRWQGRAGERWAFPAAPTPGSANIFAFNSSIVINEIMYHPRSLEATETLPLRDSEEQWIELHNSGDAEVDLAGWRFSDGIDFVFPAPSVISPGGYLVVARQPQSLADKHPGIAITGPFSGNLSRSGERLRLLDAFGNLADEVRYADGGSWPGRADGGGSSLELRDPRADNSRPGAWAASDESHRTSWQTYSYTLRATNGQGDPTQYNEFIFGLLDEGEILIDDISVVENRAGVAHELIQNGGFTGGAGAWRFLGTHRHAAVIDDPEEPGNSVLRMRASGATEHMHNHAETTLKAGANLVTINSNSEYRISFRARWLGGSNQLNTRLYFNRVARTTRLAAFQDGGTPGRVNSTHTSNLGPTLHGLSHAPAVPAPGEAATVSVGAGDPDGVGAVTLYYSVDGGAFVSSAMAPQAGGLYVGTVPPQAGGAKVRFYVSAADTASAISCAPASGPDSHALIPWDDGQARLDYGTVQPNNFRIVMTAADADFMHTPTQVMSNDRLGATVIYNEHDVYYDCGVRLKGSQRGRPKDVRAGFIVRFPADRPFLGAHGSVAVDRSGAGDQFSQKEILIKHAISRAGRIPGMNDDLIRIIAPKQVHTGSAMLLKSRFDDEWLDNQFENGGDGRMFEYELIYYPTTTDNGTPEGLKRPEPDNVTGVSVRTLGSLENKELYRWHWLIDNNRDADDYSGLIEMLRVFGLSGAAYRDAIGEVIDVDQWLRAFAIQTLFGIGDSYSSGSQHNLLVYLRPGDGRAMYFPWDMDFTFSMGSTEGVVNNGDLTKMLGSHPSRRRAYYSHLHDIISTVFNPAYMGPWAAHYSEFLPTENLSSHVSYITARRTHVLGLINAAVPPTPFAITTEDGSSSSESTAVIQGTGWVDVAEIRLDSTGVSLPVSWNTATTWQVSVPIQPGENRITLRAYDAQGAPIGPAHAITIQGTGTVVPAGPGNLAISEIMYHPAPPTAAEQTAGFTDKEDFEFIELVNLSATHTVSLANAAFTDGIIHTLAGALIAPGGRAVLARDPAAFAARYGEGIALPDGYAASSSSALNNSGETLVLLASDGTIITEWAYSDDAPWPVQCDGAGYSLTLMRPGANDPALVASWRTSSVLGGTPGRSDDEPLAGWAAAHGVTDLASDLDADGVPALLEYAGGTDPGVHDPREFLRAEITGAGDSQFLEIGFLQKVGRDDVLLVPEISTTLDSWPEENPLHAIYLGRTNLGDGTEEVRFRAVTPVSASPQQFLRVRLIGAP